ncbi:MAG: IS110 family transposase [Gammaproteobacteria bacterium]
MHIATVAIDLAKSVFEVAAADAAGRVIERKRLSRIQLEAYFQNRSADRIVMEACGSAHHWARCFMARGFRVSLLPPHYVRAYVRRNKTDRADASALLEAARAPDIIEVRVKSLEQQAIQGLHRIRSAWKATKTARINTLRGLCREFGVSAPSGVRRGLLELSRRLAEEESGIPALVRSTMRLLLEEIVALDAKLQAVERELREVANQSAVCERLQTIPGVGLLTSTAFVGSVGDISGFKNARRFSCWLGLTPREYSSGNIRRLGGISKRGDGYLRMLLIHGARAVLWSASAARRAKKPLDALRTSALELMTRHGHNKAAVAVANKLARIVWATWSRERVFASREPTVLA